MNHTPEPNRRNFLVGLSGLVATPLLVPPHPASAQRLTGAERAATIAEAEQVFAKLRSVAGDFRQVDPNGRRSSGKFWMQRPDKLRFEYAPPSGLVLIADGTNVTVQDTKLKSINRYPQRATPLHFLLKEDLDLAQDVIVEDVQRSGNDVTLRLRDRRREADGALTVTLDRRRGVLEQWTITDNRNRRTTVQLSSVTQQDQIDRSLFRAPPPPRRRGR